MRRRELEARSALLDEALPAGLQIEWLGVSGYRLTFERSGAVHRPLPVAGAAELVAAAPDRAPRSERSIDRYCPPREGHTAVGVLVGHTHFDHAVDAPAIARRFGCLAYGSDSLARLMRLHGLGEQAVVVTPYEDYELGPFRVSFTPSRHSKLLLGAKVPFDGELTCDHLDSLAPGAYRCGQVWGILIEVGGVRLYHQGSADLLDEALRPPPGGIDVFLAGVAGRNFTDDYWQRILPKLDPALIVPTHYDDFFVPLGESQEPIANVKLAELPEEIGAVSRDAQVAALPRLDR